MPPGFHLSAVHADPFAAALHDAAAGDPGTVFWNGEGGRCQAAVLLAPDRPVDAAALTNLGLLALFDALAVLAPPQVPLHVAAPASLLPASLLPASLLIDGARAATVQAILASGTAPEWAVLGFDVAMQAETADPGHNLGETWLMEEGFEDVAAADLVAHFCRHLLAWIDAWHDGGGPALAQAVASRMPREVVRA